jgi:hypothetical protein
MAWCDFVTDNPNGMGVLHCLGDKDHEQEHWASRKYKLPKSAVWRRFPAIKPQEPVGVGAEDLYGEPLTTNQPEAK